MASSRPRNERDGLARCSHPYTISLLAAAPVADPELARRQLQASSRIDTGAEARPLSGCPFRPRCAVGRDRAICADETPPLLAHEPDHWAACHFPGELDPGAAGWSNGRAVLASTRSTEAGADRREETT